MLRVFGRCVFAALRGGGGIQCESSAHCARDVQGLPLTTAPLGEAGKSGGRGGGGVALYRSSRCFARPSALVVAGGLWALGLSSRSEEGLRGPRSASRWGS